MLRDDLEDDATRASVIRHIVERHPETAEAAYRIAPGQRAFTWAQDEERLLARFKPVPPGQGPAPSMSVVGSQLSGLLNKSS